MKISPSSATDISPVDTANRQYFGSFSADKASQPLIPSSLKSSRRDLRSRLEMVRLSASTATQSSSSSTSRFSAPNALRPQLQRTENRNCVAYRYKKLTGDTSRRSLFSSQSFSFGDELYVENDAKTLAFRVLSSRRADSALWRFWRCRWWRKTPLPGHRWPWFWAQARALECLTSLASVDVFIRARCGYGDVNYMAFSPTSTLSTAVEHRQIESLHKNGET